ncbi:MAG: polysaccharide biosynthesis tyrosine autokinase [Armatimonadota bacterium]
MYKGETKVMERQPTEAGVPVYGGPYVVQSDIQMHLADLAYIASSNTVLTGARDTLKQLGVLNSDDLMKTLDIKPVTDTQILAISVVSNNADDAKTAADVIAMEFKRFYNELVSDAAEQSREFIEKQLKDAKVKLTESREARAAYKEKNSLVELGEQTSVLVQRAAAIETDVVNASVDADNARGRLKSIEAQINGKPEMRLSAKSVANNPVYQSLLGQLVAAESDLGTMLGKEGGSGKGKNHPEVQELTKRIEELKKQIKSQSPMIVSQETTALDQVITSAISNKMSIEAELAGAEARRGALATALQEEKAKLNVLPEQEMRMAQLDMDVTAAEDTYKLLQSKLEEARIKASETSKSSTIQVITPAYVYPVDPKTSIKLALAFFLSPLLGIGVAFLLNYMDNSVKTPAEAEELLGLPISSVIPLRRSHALARRPDNEPLIASYAMLTTQLWRVFDKSSQPVILVASAEPDSGRTTTAANLAVTLAKDGARVILVDADMRKPDQHSMFGVSGKPGLSNVLTGVVEIEDALVPTKVDGLLLMPAGPAPDNPIRLLRTQQMTDFIKEIGTLADYVVFDSPAGVTFADATMLASRIKNVVLVYSAGRVPRGAEVEFRNRLNSAGARILGVVLNRVKPEDSHGYFYYKRFYQDITAQSIASVPMSVKSIPQAGPNDTNDDNNV